ncbi:Acylneuraminate cytidylyltransferase [Pseudodesulfovibrio piezophilus C1TLV30]|uniref:Acylneuraminate cytidylyltransferase n=2 Tax=Pseudodesulfovibrio TaxID=2035811 RepID=M1WRX8_PSEP2|nr:Acylneuraminate cytidylyltransferase [Pseudodesulfovibrio piezophilus C1TLV30]
MGSTRLPGKVCLPIMGRPMLEIELERLKACTCIDEIILATSNLETDNMVAEIGDHMGIRVFRGSEDDVLDRYYQAATMAQAQNIMRVTGDCPLIDCTICAATVSLYNSNTYDYVRTSPQVAEGLDCEVFSYAALKQAWEHAEIPMEREHVTYYINRDPKRFSLAELPMERDDSNYRVTVDEQDDFNVVSAIFEALTPKHGLHFSFDAVRDFLDNSPEVSKLNSTIIRNESFLKDLSKS